METTTLDEIQNFKCKKLQELLDKCSDGSQKLFERMYGTTEAFKMDPDKLDWAIQ